MRLDVASVLLGWGTGGLRGCWITTRHRVVGLGYGWLLRSVFGAMLIGGAAAGLASADTGTGAAVRDVAGTIAAVAAAIALAVSVVQRRAGFEGEGSFNPHLDLLAPAAGFVALLGAAD